MGAHWFDGLSEKAYGFLLASMVFRSRDFENLFSLLDESDSELMFERAQAIASLERTQRVELLLSELKRSLFRSSQPWILAVHPSWLVAILKQETQQIQKIALASLPLHVSKMVSDDLGINVTEVDLMRNLPNVILDATKKSIEKQLVQMRSVSFESTFTHRQLLVMSKEDLKKVVLESSVESFSASLAQESNDIGRQILQRLEYNLAQQILGCMESGAKEDNFDLHSLVVNMAEKGAIDDRFAKCTK